MRDFLTALYGELDPNEHWAYLWMMKGSDKPSRWFQTAEIDTVADEAGKLHDYNIYYSIGFTAANLGPHQRGKEADLAGIIGFVADIDFATKDKPRCPRDEAEALQLIDSLPLRPTACVHSGNGLQAVWMFKEPLAFADDNERINAKNLSAAWWQTVAAIASRQSWEVDAVHDLTRVMRLPGTFNVKDPTDPKPVRLLWLEPATRYNPPFDFEPHVTFAPRAIRQLPLPQVTIDDSFPAGKMQILMENEEFRRLFEHKRRLPNDSSTSGYDMAIANLLVGSDWSDNDIANVLRHHRQQWGRDKPEKINNAGYYARTIQAARQSLAVTEEKSRAKEVLAEGTADRDQTISEIGAIMEIALTNIQVVTGDPGILRLWIGGKSADVLLTTLTSPASTTAAILNTAMVYPRPVGGKKGAETWRSVVQNMLRVAEKVDAGAEATAEGSFLSLLQLFAERRTAVTVPPGELPDDGNNPFRREGRIWFRLKDLMQVLQRSNAKLTQREVVQRLTVLGAERKTHKVKGIDGTTTTRRFYGVEEEKIEGED